MIILDRVGSGHYFDQSVGYNIMFLIREVVSMFVDVINVEFYIYGVAIRFIYVIGAFIVMSIFVKILRSVG